MKPNKNNLQRLTILLLAFLLISCGEQNQTREKVKDELKPLSKTDLPNCVLDVEARQIKKCSPEIKEAHQGFGGLLMIDAIRPDTQWVPTTGMELKSEDGANVLRITFSVKKWAVDEEGNEQVSKTPFIGSIEKWKNKELQWRKDVNAKIQPSEPFAFSFNWQSKQNLAITLNDEEINLEDIDFDIRHFSIFGSGVRVATSEFGTLNE